MYVNIFKTAMDARISIAYMNVKITYKEIYAYQAEGAFIPI